MANNSKKHNIIVLGGNFGGVQVIHYLFKHTLPALEQIIPDCSFQITLVTPNSRFYFKIAAPRLLINGQLLQEDACLRPLTEAFSRYPEDKFTLITGVAIGLDPSRRKVSIQANEKPSEIQYDTLIITTGTTSKSALWTIHEDETLTKSALLALNQSLPNSKTIMIAGGGPVGVETAGEIASNYPSSNVTLFSGGTQLLPRAGAGLGQKAEAYLIDKYAVKVVHNIQVESTSPATDGSAETIVHFSDGSNQQVSTYIDATGGRPNSDFLPKSWLDDTGRVKTKDGYFRVASTGGDSSEDGSRVYALGDIVAGSPNTMLAMEAQIPCVCSSIGVDIRDTLQSPGKTATSPSTFRRIVGLLPGTSGGKVLSQRGYKPMKDTLIVPIGVNGGVGSVMGFGVPSFFVKMAKGKSYLIEQTQPIVTGSKW